MTDRVPAPSARQPEEVEAFAESAHPLCARYDVALLDLDGVVYVGDGPVPGAPAALTEARRRGMRLAFVTNNAARPASAVATRLAGMGVAADPIDVITSAQTAAHYLADRLPPGSAVLVVGGAGLVEALHERGLRPVASADDDPAAVVQGFAPATDWAMLSEGAVAIGRGVPWIATNTDSTVPSDRGPLPGNGSLVAALREATGYEPTVTGKPQPTMHRETLERTGAVTPLVVGDRLDTDIEGAHAVGCPSLLVLSGVTDIHTLLAAAPGQRPTYLGRDVSALLHAHPATTLDRASSRCGRWQATARPAGIELAAAAADEAAGADGLDAVRALAAQAWAHATGNLSAADPDARAELGRLGLD
ncbi:MAG: HAD-IIA family hydrolase [Jatrophihabitans sp.]